MAQSKGAVYPAIGIDLEALSHQLLQVGPLSQNLLACFHRVNVLPLLELTVSLSLVDSPVAEEPPKPSRRSLIYHPLRKTAAILLHHQQMLYVRVRSEKQLPRNQLGCYASYRPYVCDLVPIAALQNHLGRAILPCTDYRAMRLIESSRPSEVDKPNLAALWQPVFLSLGRVSNQILLLEQNIFWLEIRVRVAYSMDERK